MCCSRADQARCRNRAGNLSGAAFCERRNAYDRRVRRRTEQCEGGQGIDHPTYSVVFLRMRSPSIKHPIAVTLSRRSILFPDKNRDKSQHHHPPTSRTRNERPGGTCGCETNASTAVREERVLHIPPSPFARTQRGSLSLHYELLTGQRAGARTPRAPSSRRC